MAGIPKTLLIFGLLTLTIQVNVVLADIGTATAYHPPYPPKMCTGNSQDLPSGSLIAAVNEELCDHAEACARRYRLRCLTGYNRPCRNATIDVTVVDCCQELPCPSTFLLSKDAFTAISSSANSKIKVEYIQI